MAKIVLWLFGLITLVLGVYSFFAPASIAQMVGLGPIAPGGTTEIRAFYGGLEIGIGLYWILTAIKPAITRAGLYSMVFVWGAVALTRGIGVLLDSSASSTMLGALGLETVATVLAIIALKRLPASLP